MSSFSALAEVMNTTALYSVKLSVSHFISHRNGAVIPLGASIALPRGIAESCDQLFLRNNEGNAQLFQAKVLHRWPDGSIRWCRMEWLHVPACSTADDTLSVEVQGTSELRHRIDRCQSGMQREAGSDRDESHCTWDQTWNALGIQLRLIDNENRTWISAPANWSIVEDGPVYQRLQCEFAMLRDSVRDCPLAISGSVQYFPKLSSFGISWTLCVEEQFYLLIAPLLLILSRKVWITCALAMLIIVPMVGRWLVGDPAPWVTHLRIDGCAFGVLLAHVFINHPRLWKWLAFLAPWGIFMGVVALLGLMLQRYRGQYGEMPLSAYGLLSGLLVVQSQASPFWKDRASHVILRYIASRSYSLYLVHVEAIAVARRLETGNFVAYLAITLLISVVLAELLYRLVEKPWMAFRDRGKSEASVTTVSLAPVPVALHQPTPIADQLQSREPSRILDR